MWLERMKGGRDDSQAPLFSCKERLVPDFRCGQKREGHFLRSGAIQLHPCIPQALRNVLGRLGQLQDLDAAQAVQG